MSTGKDASAARFDSYATLIQALPAADRLTKPELLRPEFRLYQDKDKHLEIYYAPFDHVNREAKVVLVGITPGWTQMEIAYREAHAGLHAGLDPATILKRCDERASFAGTMRGNLLDMLEDLELPKCLNIPSSESLFSEHRALLHTTSALRYPVFVKGSNYRGDNPKPLKTPALLDFIEDVLAPELQQVPQAVIIPLGESVSGVINHLINTDRLDRSRCLLGFPHPSGANGHRKRHFDERRERLSRALREWFA